MPFLFVFFFWDTYDSNVGAFNIVPEILEVVLISFNSFFFSVSFTSTILSSTSLILSPASVILLLVPSRVLFISAIALFIFDWLFFVYSRSLLNISCIFSILVSRLFVCNCIFVFKILDHLSYHYSELFFRYTPYHLLFSLVLSSSFTCGIFSTFSFCSDCCVWGALSIAWKFMVPLYFGVSSLWMGLD